MFSLNRRTVHIKTYDDIVISQHAILYKCSLVDRTITTFPDVVIYQRVSAIVGKPVNPPEYYAKGIQKLLPVNNRQTIYGEANKPFYNSKGKALWFWTEDSLSTDEIVYICDEFLCEYASERIDKMLKSLQPLRKNIYSFNKIDIPESDEEIIKALQVYMMGW